MATIDNQHMPVGQNPVPLVNASKISKNHPPLGWDVYLCSPTEFLAIYDTWLWHVLFIMLWLRPTVIHTYVHTFTYIHIPAVVD